MMTTYFLVYALFFLAVIIGRVIITELESKKLCSCYIKVPFTLMSGLVMLGYYALSGYTLSLMIIIVMGLAMIGNALVGNLSKKFKWAELTGQISLLLSYVVMTVTMIALYGIPTYYVFIIISSLFIIYISYMKFWLKISFLKNWQEYIYMTVMIIMLSVAFQTAVPLTIMIAITFWFYSELILQISRLTNLLKPKAEYNAASIYLLAMAFLAMPENFLGVL